MSVNKNQLVRYKILDDCFRTTGRIFDIDELVRHCNKKLQEMDYDTTVSKRTVWADISYMQSEAGWSIELDEHLKEGKKRLFRYKDLDFSIQNLPLNKKEVSQFKEIVNMLKQFSGNTRLEWLDELLPKLEFGIDEGGSRGCILFDDNPYIEGNLHITPLFEAITHQKVLRISYREFTAEAHTLFTFHPHFLKQYNNRWYLFGYCEERSDAPVWNLPLDRIESIEPIAQHTYKPSGIDVSEYFENVIGVTRFADKEPELITLHVSPTWMPYLKNKPLHGSQKKPKALDSGKYEFTLEVIINKELENQLLAMGEHVKVVAPLSLLEILKKRLVEALSLYE